MRTVEENIFGVSKTFRKGQIGGWREEFSKEHARATREIAGPPVGGARLRGRPRVVGCVPAAMKLRT